MLKRLKQYLFLGLVGGAIYFLLNQHIVFYERDFFLLPKEELTLEYTFFSIQEKSPDAIMVITPLRRAGIGDILVNVGIISDDERYELEEYYEYEAEYE